LKRIRILLSEMAPMLLDIVANIVAAQPDMDIVEGVESETDLLKAVEFSDEELPCRGSSTDYSVAVPASK
jgi:hypothetical protein